MQVKIADLSAKIMHKFNFEKNIKFNKDRELLVKKHKKEKEKFKATVGKEYNRFKVARAESFDMLLRKQYFAKVQPHVARVGGV